MSLATLNAYLDAADASSIADARWRQTRDAVLTLDYGYYVVGARLVHIYRPMGGSEGSKSVEILNIKEEHHIG